MKKINRIICCCGHGLGSSLLVRLNIENVLEANGIKGISVEHASLSEIAPYRADLFIAGLDVVRTLKEYPRVIVLKDLISYEELENKLLKALNSNEEKFWIE
ncbi:MAG: PTS sugar transporter subunit IIB [Holdemanella sp.]|nr:PTS sugar transporter subunit IIB [Holdemanella sp.]